MNWKLLTYVMGANCILFFVWAHLNTGFDEFGSLFDSGTWGYSSDYEEEVFLLLSGLSFIGTTFCGACWFSESQKSPNF